MTIWIVLPCLVLGTRPNATQSTSQTFQYSRATLQSHEIIHEPLLQYQDDGCHYSGKFHSKRSISIRKQEQSLDGSIGFRSSELKRAYVAGTHGVGDHDAEPFVL